MKLELNYEMFRQCLDKAQRTVQKKGDKISLEYIMIEVDETTIAIRSLDEHSAVSIKYNHDNENITPFKTAIKYFKLGKLKNPLAKLTLEVIENECVITYYDKNFCEIIKREKSEIEHYNFNELFTDNERPNTVSFDARLLYKVLPQYFDCDKNLVTFKIGKPTEPVVLVKKTPQNEIKGIVMPLRQF